MKRVAAALVAGLVVAGTAAAHEPGAPTNVGFVATVSSVEPNTPGLQARIVLGDQLVVTNLTRRPVVILDLGGEPWRTIPSGKSQTWHDPRVIVTGEPPQPRAGARADAPRFVRNWVVPGRTAGERFAITGFVGYVPPRAGANDDGMPWLAVAAGGGALLVLLAGAAYLVARRRPSA